MSKKSFFISIVAIILAFGCVWIAIIIDSEDRYYEQAVSLNKQSRGQISNVLVLGKDKASGLFDVIILASINEENSKACLMQIPRDTYANYTENGYRKINGAPKILGEEEFCNFISETLKIEIKGYVSFDLDAFSKVVDLVGGVEIELPKALDYEDPEQNLYIHLPKGKQVLDGEHAQMLVRFRKGYLRGDLDRLDVQKRFMAAFFGQVKSSVNILNAYRLITEILPEVDTNITAISMAALGMNALKVEESNIGFLTLPGEDARDEKNGISYYVMSAQTTNEILEEYFGKFDGQIDDKKLFLNSNYKKFNSIYNKKYDYDLMFAQDLK